MKGRRKLMVRSLYVLITLYMAISASSYSFGYEADASKPINNIGEYAYSQRNLKDWNLLTAWCTSGKTNEKPWIEINYKKPRQLKSLTIINGYAKNINAYENNSRPKMISIFTNGEKIAGATLDDKPTMQNISFKEVFADKLKITIDEIYEGKKYDDICLTEIIDDPRVEKGYRQLTELENIVGRRALSANEIRDYLTPFIEEYYQKEADPTFWTIVSLRSSELDERGLRLLMDLSYCEKEYYEKKVVNVDIREGLRDMVINFIVSKPAVILNVLDDVNQVEWGLVKSAVSQYYSALPPQELKQKKSIFEKIIKKLKRNIQNIIYRWKIYR